MEKPEQPNRQGLISEYLKVTEQKNQLNEQINKKGALTDEMREKLQESGSKINELNKLIQGFGSEAQSIYEEIRKLTPQEKDKF
jgi:uncharacterized coiled-coil DUF342 family protein